MNTSTSQVGALRTSTHRIETPSPRTGIRNLFTGVALLACLSASHAAAATWYLDTNQGSGVVGDWDTLAQWNSLSSGSGVDATSFSSSDTYVVRAKKLRSPTTGSSATQTFLGGILTINSGTLALKSASTFVTTLETTGNPGDVGVRGPSISNEGSSAITLGVNHYTVSFDTKIEGSQGLTIEAGTLTGTANLNVLIGNLSLSATTATSYTGTLSVASAKTLSFGNGIVSGGGLELQAGSFLSLNQNVSFQSVTIAGTALETGSHTYADLKIRFGNQILDGGSGSITVTAIPEPGSVAALIGLTAAGFVLTTRSKR
jgi:hypothetical protein